MVRQIRNVVILVWVSTTSAVAELQPEIQMDRFLIGAKRLLDEKDPEAALIMMDKVLKLRDTHDGVKLPNNFNFEYAQIAFSAGQLKTTIDFVNKHLAKATRDGEFYWDALKLLDTAEASLPNNNRCHGQPKGTACWMELTGPKGCYVWNPNLQPGEKVTWTGKCVESLANGTGILEWVWAAGEKTAKSEGRLHAGRRQGQWVEYFEDGYVATGPYKAGKRHGKWVLREEDGNILRQVTFEEGIRVSSED